MPSAPVSVLSSGNSLYEYSLTGTQLDSFTFPDPNLVYTDVAVSGNTIYASYTSPGQKGVTVRDMNLDQQSFFNIGLNINGIAAGDNNDVYLASGNSLYHYSANGTLLNFFTFSADPNLVYSDIAFEEGKVYASFNSTGFAGNGVTVRDPSFNQLGFFNTGFPIEGITAESEDGIYVTSANTINGYSAFGVLQHSLTFPDPTIDYTDIDIEGNRVYASFNSPGQKGVTVRDLNLVQQNVIATPFAINGIAMTDPPVDMVGVDVSATEGTPFNGVVAKFTDPAGAEQVGDYSANINWGDGSSSPGTISTASVLINVYGGFVDSFNGGTAGGMPYSDLRGNLTANDIQFSDTNSLFGGTFGVGEFGADLTGSLNVAADGAYTFGLNSDDGSELFIDGVSVATARIAPVSPTVILTAGVHTFEIQYFEDFGPPGYLFFNLPAGVTYTQFFAVSGAHTYAEDGALPITVTVDHDAAIPATATATASVGEVPIFASGVFLSSINEGDAAASVVVATFTHANGVEPPSAFTALVDWGIPGQIGLGTVTQPGGPGNGYMVTATRPVYPDDGVFPVVVFIAEDGVSATVNDSITVNNVPATNLVLNSGTIDENGVFTLNGSFTDPGSLDPHTVTVNWGEGAPETFSVPAGQTTFSVTHQYLDDNPSGTPSDNYTVSVSVVDNDIAQQAATASTTVTVNNVAPSIDSLSATPADENGFVTLTGAYSDVGTQDTHSVFITWGDGSATFMPVSGGTFTFTHQYLDDNPTGTPSDVFTIGVVLSDDDGGIAFATTPTTISNVAPVITSLSATPNAFENGVVILSGTYSDVGTQDTHTITIDWGEGAPVTAPVSGGTFSFTHQYLDDNPSGTPSDLYTISATVTDDDGGSDTETTTTTITNVAPVINTLSATPIALENGLVTLTGTYSDVGTQDTHTLTINWGDGAPETAPVSGGTFSVTHQYLDDTPTGTPADNYTIGVTLTDDDTGSDTKTAATTILNVAPVINTMSATSANEGGVVTLTGAYSDMGTQDTHSLFVTWGDGATTFVPVSGGTFSLTHTYLDDPPTGTPSDTLNIAATLIDDDGGIGFGVTTTTITNVAPVINTLSATSANENGFVTLSGTYSDVGTQDTHTLTINWGEGAPVTVPVVAGSFSFTHQYLDDNPTGTPSDVYNIGVTLTDDDTGSVTRSTTTTITNVAPVIDTLSATPSINENGTVTLSGTYHDVGTLDTHTLTINWGEGAPVTVPVSGGTFSATHQYLDDNPSGTPSDTFTIGVTLKDDDTGSVTGSTTTTVANVAPVIDILAVTPSINENGTVTLSGTYHDVGTLDTHTLTINWGEGAPVTLPVSGGRFSFTHQYLDDNPTGTPSDTYTIGVTLTDDDGGSDSRTTTTTVMNVAPVIDSLSATSAFENGVVTLTGTYHDVGTQDTHTLTIDWGEGAPVTVPVSGGTFSVTHQYLDDNPTGTPSDVYTIGVTLTDDDTASVTGSTTTTITNVAPVLNTLAATSVDENGVVHLTGTYSDVGTQDTHTLTINWGEGAAQTVSVNGGAFDITHQYLDDNPTGTPSDVYTIDVTLTDDDTGSVMGSTTTTITNVAPTITSVSNTSPDCGLTKAGDSVAVSVSFADVGTLDTHRVVIEWGDGTMSSSPAGGVILTQGNGFGSATASHVYTTGGIFDIKVTVTDDDTGMVETHTTAVVAGVRLTSAGVLQIVGTEGKDKIEVKADGPNGQTTKLKAKFDDGPNHWDVTLQAPTSQINKIVMMLCDGDDDASVDNKITAPAYIDGDDGDDKLTGGGGDDSIYGGAGQDKIKGKDGNDYLDGGDGDDKIAGGRGGDVVFGGAGNDDLKGGSDGGSDGGVDSNDIVVGGDGDDKLDGGKGMNLLIGGRGRDELKGGSGGSVGGNILISGYTSYDANVTTLKAILNAWTSGWAAPNPNYNTIVTAVQGLLPSNTVFDDGVSDKVTGDNNSRDLFFVTTNKPANNDDVSGTGGDKVLQAG